MTIHGHNRNYNEVFRLDQVEDLSSGLPELPEVLKMFYGILLQGHSSPYSVFSYISFIPMRGGWLGLIIIKPGGKGAEIGLIYPLGTLLWRNYHGEKDLLG